MEITKIVLTGGPCSGKTTLLKEIKKCIEEWGLKVVVISETATELIEGGITPHNCKNPEDFQLARMILQRTRERIYESAISDDSEDVLIICDRGMMDSRAYMDEERFESLLSKIGMTVVEARDTYSGVFHLCTAAKGKEEFYTLSNNPARTEGPERARTLDDRILSAWCGAPHLRVIEATQDMEEKKEKLLFEIKALLGIPEPLETERKFLIEYPDTAFLESYPFCKKISIVQTYLESDSDEEIRVRKRGDGKSFLYYHTVKRNLSSVKRQEIERRISEREYEELLLLSDKKKRPVEKERFCIVYDCQYFEMDVYPFMKDRAVVEIELSDEEQSIHFPDWIKVIREVTGEKEYKNSSLAKI